MKKIIGSVIIAAAIIGTGSLALASTTTPDTSGFSVNHIAFTQSDWGSVSGFGYTALAQCPAGQQYVSAYVESQDNNGAYNIQDVNTIHYYLHHTSGGQPDGIYLFSGSPQGYQGNGVVELTCAS
jgi:hypothetical protein